MLLTFTFNNNIKIRTILKPFKPVRNLLLRIFPFKVNQKGIP